MDRDTAINEFLRRYAEDWARGGSRPLADYRALFPGHETAIDEQYSLVTGAAPEPDRPDSTAGGSAAAEDEAAPLGTRTGVGFELGPYVLLRELGRGGQGEVWLARDRRIDRKVALKTLTAVGRLSAQGVERLRREARVASRLDHPGICTVYEADQVEGVPFVAMRWIEGTSLRSAIRRAREGERGEALPLPARTREDVLAIAGFFEAAARALHHAHERGVLHRDVKPGNVLVGADGEPVLLDFGLARDLEGDEASLSDGISGTPAYLAPERLAVPAAPADLRIDVYGLGVSLYEALTLERPFAAATREHLFRAILEDEPADPRRSNPAVPRELAVVVATAMAKEPDRRYESAAAMAADLAAVREHRPIAARPPSLVQRLRLWSSRHPRLAGISALLALATVATAGLSGFLFARWPDMRAGRAAAAEEERRARMELGFAELGELDRGRARAAFEAALASAPDDVLARAGLALAHLAENAPGAALAALDAHPGPLPPELAAVRSEALRWAGDWSGARALDASLPAPSSTREHFVRGSLELFRGHEGRSASFEPAVQHLTKALLRPERGFAFEYVTLADALRHAPDEERAREVAEAMVLGWPDRPDVLLCAGIALEERDPPAARRALERALEVEPASALAAVTLAGLVLETEGPAAAQARVDALRARCRDASERAMLARLESRIARHEGRREDALEHLRAAARANPARELHASELMHFVAETEGVERLAEEARALLVVAPEAVRPRVVLAERLLERGDHAGAAAMAEEVHRRTPWNVPAHSVSGFVAAVEQDCPRAIHHFERALECQHWPNLAYELLRARLDAGLLEGLAAAARELDAEGVEGADRLARVADHTTRFLAEGVPPFSATVGGTVTELEAAARARELRAEYAEAETAWARFGLTKEPPATSAGTAWWRSARAGLLAAGADAARAEAPRVAIETELAAAERAWRSGRIHDRRLGQFLHRFATEPALERWRSPTAAEPWRALFAHVRELREELARDGG